MADHHHHPVPNAAARPTASCCGGHGHDHAEHAQRAVAGACCGGSHGHQGHGQDGAVAAAGKVKDPVCGMNVDPHTAKHRAEHDGHPYYFCSAGCRTKFVADPPKYLVPGKAHTEPVPEGTIYTCRCTRRCARSAQAPARSAAWRSNRCW